MTNFYIMYLGTRNTEVPTCYGTLVLRLLDLDSIWFDTHTYSIREWVSNGSGTRIERFATNIPSSSNGDSNTKFSFPDPVLGT